MPLANATSHPTWAQRCPLILKAIREAEFVTIDLELTGLHSRDERFVGVERCYEAHAEGARQFLPVQVGICTARRSPSDPSRWLLTPSSIYIYPTHIEDKTFQVSIRTLNFLRDNAFNFNEWVGGGIGFIRPRDEEERRAVVQSKIDELQGLQKKMREATSAAAARHTQGSQGQGGAGPGVAPLALPEGYDKEFVDRVRGQVRDWIECGEVRPLEIPMDNAFQRLVMHNIIGQEFPEVYSHSSKRGDQRLLCVYRSQSEVHDQQIRSLEGELQKIDEMVGVRHVFDEVSRGQKLIVGHNCFYDLLHLYQTFYDELPGQVYEFKRQWMDRFPCTLDTKYLAETNELLSALQAPPTLKGLCDFMVAIASTSMTDPSPPLSFDVQSIPGTQWSLPKAYEPLVAKATGSDGNDGSSSSSSSGTQLLDSDADQRDQDTGGGNGIVTQGGDTSGVDEFAMGVERYSDDMSHEAGFDALVTSVVFILQLNHIITKKKINWSQIDFKGPRTYSVHDKQRSVMDLLPLMINRIKLVKTQPSVINLSGKDEADMSRHFLMSGYPNNWGKWDIMKFFSPIFVHVTPIDTQSCWIIARSADDVANITSLYRASTEPPFSLLTYDEYKRLQEQQPASSPQLSPSHNTSAPRVNGTSAPGAAQQQQQQQPAAAADNTGERGYRQPSQHRHVRAVPEAVSGGQGGAVR
ncbi:unnamed protein product [Vitrella brassicaformis CCMP3155]|uniref:Poly(A)-specific ribonuclease PARN n=2 Tax=Vitrella brassicaformis TaxID=1169539 RepID=A0A0G4GUZ0_VITBC|nr:unnamed protein product [Vitrella brassicaformis CCMP3155]|eukprot:CEM34441.1 unnamed protein product [Vitrella brassicaformis CCMP3155]